MAAILLTPKCVNSLAPGKFEWNFRYVIFKRILVIDGWDISYEIALIWMSPDFTDDQSTLIQVMSWCRQATSNYLSQCWPIFLSPYGVTRPQGVLTGKKMERQTDIAAPWYISSNNRTIKTSFLYNMTSDFIQHSLFIVCYKSMNCMSSITSKIFRGRGRGDGDRTVKHWRSMSTAVLQGEEGHQVISMYGIPWILFRYKYMYAASPVSEIPLWK